LVVKLSLFFRFSGNVDSSHMVYYYKKDRHIEVLYDNVTIAG